MGSRSVLVIAVLAINLPFIFQPVHIDDRVYLEIADNALQKPWFPYDYAPLFEGILTPDAASHSHLPLLAYYLAIIKKLTGSESEWVFHLAFLVFPMLLALSFFRLASRCVQRPLLTTLFLLMSPGIMLLGHTLMTEVPLLAFWTLGIERAWRILEGEDKPLDWLFLALALVCAAMMTILSAGLVFLLAAGCLLWGKRQAVPGENLRRLAWLLALPILVWVLWYLRGYLHYDRFLLVRTVQHLDKRASFSALLIGSKGLSFLLCLGGAVFFPIVAIAGFSGVRVGLLGLIAGSGGILIQIFWMGWDLFPAIFFGVLLGAGTMAFLGTIWALALGPAQGGEKGFEGRGRYLFVLWFGGILAAALLVYPSGSVRYTLLAFPPVLIAFQWACERKTQMGLGWMVPGLVVTLAFSLALSLADYRMAVLYKEQARELVREYASRDRTVWFTAEWGFRYYLEKAGARILGGTALGPQIGDILIKPYVAFPWRTLYDGPEYLVLNERRAAAASPWIRTMDFGSKAGFYSTAWGILPYSLSADPYWERFLIYEVIKLYDGPIPEPQKHY